MLHKEELRLLEEACSFASQIGSSLKFEHEVVGTGLIFFHRYARTYPLRLFDRFKVSAVCLFIASKALSLPPWGGLTTLVKWFVYHDNKAKGQPSHSPSNQKIDKLKEELGNLELEVLHTVGYDFGVDLPYIYIREYVHYPTNITFPNQNKTNILQFASIFVNDALKTPLSLFFHPLLIAVSCLDMAQLFLSMKYSQSQGGGNKGEAMGSIKLPDLPDGRSWINFLHPQIIHSQVALITEHLKEMYKTPVVGNNIHTGGKGSERTSDSEKGHTQKHPTQAHPTHPTQTQTLDSNIGKIHSNNGLEVAERRTYEITEQEERNGEFCSERPDSRVEVDGGLCPRIE